MVLQTQLQRNYFTYSDWKIVGIIDSDGSFAFRLTKRKDNKVGFNLLNVITQTEKNKELLVHLRDQLGVTAQLRTTITGKLASGADKKCCVLDIAWTTKGGQKLLQIFKKCPPRCPGKYRNYLIGQILLESLQNKYILKKIDSQSWRPALKERISSAVAVLLSFQTSNEINPYSKTRKKESTPEEWLNSLRISPADLRVTLQFYQSYMDEIEAKVQAHEKYLMSGKARLPLDYIRGFYIGDGCISISLNTKRDPNDSSAKFYRWKQTSGKSNMNIFRLQPRFWFFERKGKIRFKRILRFHGIPLKIHYDVYFSLAGDYYTQSLFEAVHSTFGAGNIGAKPEENRSVYRLRGWEKAKNIVFPFLDNQDLPTFRQKQFQIFKAALAAYRGQTYKNLKNTKKLLVLLHDMNQGGKYRRQSQSTALYNFRKFFKLRKK